MASRMSGAQAAPPVACRTGDSSLPHDLCALSESGLAIGAAFVATLVIAAFALHPRIVRRCKRTLLRLFPTSAAADGRRAKTSVAARRVPAPKPSESCRLSKSREGEARGEEAAVRRDQDRFEVRRSTSPAAAVAGRRYRPAGPERRAPAQQDVAVRHEPDRYTERRSTCAGAAAAGRRYRPAGPERRAPAQQDAAVRHEPDRYVVRRSTSAPTAGLRAGSPVPGRRAPAPRPRQQSYQQGAEGKHAAVRREPIPRLSRRPGFSRKAPRLPKAATSLLPRHWSFSLSRSNPNMRISSGSLFYANVVKRQIAAWQQDRES